MRFKISYVFHVHHCGFHESHDIIYTFFLLKSLLEMTGLFWFTSFVICGCYPPDRNRRNCFGFLSFSCPVTPNYPKLVFFHLFFFSLSGVFWMRKNISIKICSFPGAKWLEYTPGCRSDKESFWNISNFYKASVSLLNREILYARNKVPS